MEAYKKEGKRRDIFFTDSTDVLPGPSFNLKTPHLEETLLNPERKDFPTSRLSQNLPSFFPVHPLETSRPEKDRGSSTTTPMVPWGRSRRGKVHG
jgi:hypothetical protein